MACLITKRTYFQTISQLFETKKTIPTVKASYNVTTLFTMLIFIIDLCTFYIDLHIHVLFYTVPVLLNIIHFKAIKGTFTKKAFALNAFFIAIIGFNHTAALSNSYHYLLILTFCGGVVYFYKYYLGQQSKIQNLIVKNHIHWFFAILVLYAGIKTSFYLGFTPNTVGKNVITFILFSIVVFYTIMSTVSILLYSNMLFSISMFKSIASKETIEPLSTPTQNDIENSDLKNEVTQAIQNFFVESDSYLNHDFSLQQLADELHLNRCIVSEVINRELHTNFYTLVAKHRILNATEILDTKQHLLIEGVMHEVGFNSTNTFNKYFKTFVGMTPSQYRKLHLPQLDTAC